MTSFSYKPLVEAFERSCQNPGLLREKEKELAIESKKLRAKTWRALFNLQESLKCGEITTQELTLFMNTLVTETSLPNPPKKLPRNRIQKRLEEASIDERFAMNLRYDVMKKEVENLPAIDADTTIEKSLHEIARLIKEHRSDFVVVDGKTNIPIGIVSIKMLHEAQDVLWLVWNLELKAKNISVGIHHEKNEALTLMETHGVSTLPVVDDKTGTLFAVLDRETETQKDVRSGLVLLSTKWSLHSLLGWEDTPQIIAKTTEVIEAT